LWIDRALHRDRRRADRVIRFRRTRDIDIDIDIPCESTAAPQAWFSPFVEWKASADLALRPVDSLYSRAHFSVLGER
jgi:hypothetical protein